MSEALSTCGLGALQMELNQRALKVLGMPWETFQLGVLSSPSKGNADD